MLPKEGQLQVCTSGILCLACVSIETADHFAFPDAHAYIENCDRMHLAA